MRGKFLLVFFVVLGIFVFYFGRLSLAATPGNVTELMEQGKIRTCLKPSWIGEAPHGGVQKRAKIRLTGTCGSPSGCACVMSWGLNGAVANQEEVSACETQANEVRDSLSPKRKAQLTKAGKCSANRTSKRTGKNCGDCICWSEDRAASCGHQKADLKNPILASIRPGQKTCNVIKNNLQASNSVLGASDPTVLPYGNVDVIVEEDTYRHVPNDFSAVGEAATKTQLGQGGAEGEDKTQKVGQIAFNFKNVESAQSNCTIITWDPYGRVFDAQSLEPISDVEVTLIDALTNQPAIQQYNWNNDFTGEDGVFNIQVEKEGGYKLTADPTSNHKFINNPPLNQNWSKIYSDLYNPGSSFVEKVNVATHHDIALTSEGEPYRAAVAEIVPGTLKSQSMGDSIVYMGRETFPFAKVCLQDGSRIVGKCVYANNIGNFSITVPKDQVSENKILVKATKVDLNNFNFNLADKSVDTLNVGSLSVNEENSSKNYFEPIFSHAEGYAYDEKGNPIKEATVLVKLKINDELFYQTKADKNGFFAIKTNDLPYLEYYFQFIDPKTGLITTATTSQFVSNNQTYLNSGKIDLMVDNNNDQRTTTNNNLAVVNPNNNLFGKILIIIGTLFVLIIGTLGVVFYIKRNRLTETS